MKTDKYLNICLEQAALSPLRYRHGCIVVKGGKIIGQGFNDYRSGYDGGALKTGRIKHRSAANKSPVLSDDEGDFSGISEFEMIGKSLGGSHFVHQSLSMHSEMMAINAALASCSAVPTKSSKARFHVVGDTKRKRKMRSNAIDSCRKGLQHLGKGQQQQQHEQHDYYHHHQEMQNMSNCKKKEHKSCASSHRNAGRRASCEQSESDSRPRGLAESQPAATGARQERSRSGGNRSSGKRSLRSPQNKASAEFSQNGASSSHFQQVGDAGQPVNVLDRTKHPKLVGADIYVARLAGKASKGGKRWLRSSSRAENAETSSEGTSSDDAPSDRSDSPEPLSMRCITGSLHEELSFKPSRPAGGTNGASGPTGQGQKCVVATESRPCYRCVAAMHSVGIKRVFWTDKDGQWQVNKVRDLVERIHIGAGDELDESLGLFVTKHEVLIRKRRVGDS